MRRLILCALSMAIAPFAFAADVEVLFDLRGTQTAPFPSNRFTDIELRNLTNLQIALPKPDCAVRVTDCQDIDDLNDLDGFNLQPRLSIPFSGAIDPATINSDNVFLVNLGDTTRPLSFLSREFGDVIGINQAVWDPATLTAFAESDEFLSQHTTYALIVTDGVRAADGRPVRSGAFGSFLRDLGFGRSRDRELKLYRLQLLEALIVARMPHQRVVAASVFTTQSIASNLEKIRNGIKRNTPAPANFLLSGGSRTVFPLNTLTSVVLNRQVGTAPNFTVSPVPAAALGIIPGAVGQIAFGSYTSPDFQSVPGFFPAVNSRTGVPAVQRTNTVYFNLFLPAGQKPAAGWPVAIYGHGFTDSKEGSPYLLGASMAARGIATLAINVVGHGGGALGTLTVNRTTGPALTLSAGGRGIDLDGNGTIDATEGVSATAPHSIVSSRDGLRQTVVDIMQLVRVIETGGIDADGDGSFDLDSNRIYYFGQSFGAIYGTILLGVEPNIKAGVPNVGGGPIIEVARFGAFRPAVGLAFASRVPTILNAPFAPPLFGFNENLPLRNQSVLVNSVAGALPIQSAIDQAEWATQAGDPVAFAVHVRKEPLRGSAPKPVIVQFAKGDMTVPNPTNSNLIRAGELQDRATFFRNDLAFAANPATPKNPHTFLTNIGSAAVGPLSLAAQAQIAVFFQSNGATVIDPDGAGPLFETPVALPLPEVVNFIP
jgi:hypothetical protein